MQEHAVKKANQFAGYTFIILLILGITQIILGEFITKSIALTANGIDCIGDGFVSAVVWIGLMYFKKPANKRFNYGYYKMENLASGIAAVIMIGLAIYIAFRSYNQLINPHIVETPIIGAIIAFIAAIIVGDWAIGAFSGIPASEVPKAVRAVVHMITLGLVFFIGIKVFPKSR